MKIHSSQLLNVTPTEAVALQKTLRNQIQLAPYRGSLNLVAGSDISFNKYSSTVYAGFVVLDIKTMQVIETASAVMDVDFPYIPGLLSFREIPPLLKAWKKLKTQPDVLIFDGHGIAHPRRLGIAAHAGLILNKPSIGCAKSLLTGVFEEPEITQGSVRSLRDKTTQEQIGIVLRTKNRVKPVFVSPGHLMDFESALQIILACVRKHRIPEPTRQAHLFVNQVRLNHLGRDKAASPEIKLSK